MFFAPFYLFAVCLSKPNRGSRGMIRVTKLLALSRCLKIRNKITSRFSSREGGVIASETKQSLFGSDRSVKVDARVLVATNVNLERAIQRKQFREDLYYRVSVFPW